MCVWRRRSSRIPLYCAVVTVVIRRHTKETTFRKAITAELWKCAPRLRMNALAERRTSRLLCWSIEAGNNLFLCHGARRWSPLRLQGYPGGVKVSTSPTRLTSSLPCRDAAAWLLRRAGTVPVQYFCNRKPQTLSCGIVVFHSEAFRHWLFAPCFFATSCVSAITFELA